MPTFPLGVDGIYFEDEEQRRLAALFEPRYRAIIKAVHDSVRESFGLDPDRFRLTDGDLNRYLVGAAEEVVRIDQTTKRAIEAVIASGQSAGLSTWEIGDQINRLYTETWAGRWQTVARTTLQKAMAEASLDRYAATGMVDRVQIADGDDDEPCRSRNGRTVSVSERPQLGHPNCTMVLIPILRGGIAA